MRQIALDTETTGLNPDAGERIVEIGAVEILDGKISGKTYHTYLCPLPRKNSPRALEIHKLSDAFLKGEPKFADVAEDFINFIRGSELVIHNAKFDCAFLNKELFLFSQKIGEETLRVQQLCTIVDTVILANQKHPGRSASLDALCKIYNIDKDERNVRHGALIDARLLAKVFLAMQQPEQADLSFNQAPPLRSKQQKEITSSKIISLAPQATKIQLPTPAELQQHREYLHRLGLK